MLFTAQQLPYRDTHAFSKIVLDYIDEAESLHPFYAVAPTKAGIEQAIKSKQGQNIDRGILVQVLQEQYATAAHSTSVAANIETLRSENTFTICTAHQPNLFTGPLYFIYKILHAIKLAGDLKKDFPQYQFVPVYYMGSEDADKEELLHTYIAGKKIEWQTAQTGAVGRMTVDDSLVRLIDEMAGTLNVSSFGKEIVQQFYAFYKVGQTVQAATFGVVHALFKKFGLVVLIADHGLLKNVMQPVFEDDLFEQLPSQKVEQTVAQLGTHYNIQANPRDINLFYLTGGIRNRIIKQGSGFLVHDTNIRFTEAELKAELYQHPERFSPNVILRGLFQETVLPNIAFIGGGGELAYWLQLKNLFDHYAVPLPALVLRNSFLIIDKKTETNIRKWNLSSAHLFEPELQIVNSILKEKGKLPGLNGDVAQLVSVYEGLKKLTVATDITLQKHVEALKVRSLQQLSNLEKKIARAERRKHETLQQQVKQIKTNLFPNGGLQERAENFSSFYAKWGSDFIEALLQQSPSLDQQFTILREA